MHTDGKGESICCRSKSCGSTWSRTFFPDALALEPSTPEVMPCRLRSPQEALLSRQFLWLSTWQGLVLAGITLAAYAFERAA